MSLFIGNLSKSITSSELEKTFGDFGSCRINYKGSFAFAEFENEKDAEDALENLQSKEMGGRRINIEWSKKSRRFDESKRRRRSVSPRRKDGRCYNCGSKGHFLRDCKRKRRHSRSRSRSRSRRRSSRDRRHRRKRSYSRSSRSRSHSYKKRGRSSSKSSSSSRSRRRSESSRDRSPNGKRHRSERNDDKKERNNHKEEKSANRRSRSISRSNRGSEEKK